MNESDGSYEVRIAHWTEDSQAIHAVRDQVFVVEQHVSTAEEWDGQDPSCTHVLAEGGDGSAIGTGRLLPEGRIGRMAVCASHRGRGVGAAMLSKLIEIAETRGQRRLVLAAQVRAMGFYRRFGFIAEGEVFLDAEIPHRTMVREA